MIALLLAAAGKGTAVVLVSHNQALARATNRIIRLKDGQVVADEPNLDPVPAAELAW